MTNIYPIIEIPKFIINKFMSRNNSGRKPDIKDIDIQELKDWLKNNKTFRKLIICQSIISLSEGAKMTEVCNVFNVTRESVRKWKNQLRKDGLQGLLKEKKVGKRSKLNNSKREHLKRVINKFPKDQGYADSDKWTGKLIKEYVKNKWNINITIRTAQLWLKKIR